MTGTEMSLLIVDDDKAFLQRLARAMETRGYVVDTADTVAEGIKKAEAMPPAFAVVDMRLEDGNGLDVIELVRKRRPDSRVVVLTGYGNIATAVTAVKLGAVDYLAKPADADEIHFALTPRARRARPAAGKSDVGRSRPLGTHPARLRTLRPQCLGDRAPAEHAPPDVAADTGEARPAVSRPR